MFSIDEEKHVSYIRMKPITVQILLKMIGPICFCILAR